MREFTYEHYSSMVNVLKERYSFTTFSQGKELCQSSSKPLVIMRHDIDMELEAAVNIAVLENELEISSTFFFMVRCPLYNLFSGTGSSKVKQILSNGHHLGLHFDCALYYDLSTSNINDYISRECSLIEQFFGSKIDSISFHRPGKMELNGITLSRWPNSYEKVFTEDFEYFSDSRGNWARGNPTESTAFADLKNLHILTHPVWWNDINIEPYPRLLELVKQIGTLSEQYLSENCQVWDRG